MNINYIVMTKLSATALTAALIGFLASSQVMSAQKKDNSHLPYAFGNTLETSVGCNLSSNGHGFAQGPEFNLRYTYYWGKHFGAYGHLGISGHDMDMSDAFKNFDSGFTYETSINSGSSISSFCSYFTAGIAYRLDFGKWSFRPKAGLGYGEYGQYYYSYYRFRKSASSDTPEYVTISSPYDKYNFYNSTNSIALETSVQMAYTLRNHFFIFAEISGLLMPAQLKAKETVYATRKVLPENWADAAIGPKGDKYVQTEEIISSQRISHMACGNIGLSFGIGWNIGFNRNTSNRYRQQ